MYVQDVKSMLLLEAKQHIILGKVLDLKALLKWNCPNMVLLNILLFHVMISQWKLTLNQVSVV